MAKPAALDDPELRDRLIAAIEAHPKDAGAAARAVGLSRQQVRRYAAQHPELEARIAAARSRSKIIADRMPGQVGRMHADVGESAEAPSLVPLPTPSAERRAAIAEALGVDEQLVADADRALAAFGFDVASTCELVNWHARNPESRACGQALNIQANVVLGPIMRAQQRREEREAADMERASQADEGPRRVVLELPDNGTHAARRRDTEVVDAEIVDDHEDAAE